MEFEWDDAKAQTNAQKHWVRFEIAAHVFADPSRIIWEDTRQNYGERRLVTLGMAYGRLLAVVYVERRQCIRIISARKANQKEQFYYGNQQTHH